MANGGGARIGDAERRAVVDLLRHHTAEGRLTLDEFADRAGEVYAAVTRDDLDKVIADLPEGIRPEPGVPAPVPPAPAATPLDAGPPARPRRFVAIMSGSHIRGSWRTTRHIQAFAWWGSVIIDLRDAQIDSPVVEITAWAIMGGVKVIVPPGTPTELDGMVLMGDSHNGARGEATTPGAPLVRVRARGLWGSVTVRNPRKRRHHGDVQALVHDHLTEALDRAQDKVDRALTTGSVDDRIPEAPKAPRAAAPAAPRSPRAPASPKSPAPPGPPWGRGLPPMPSPGDWRAWAQWPFERADDVEPDDDPAPAAAASRIPPGTLTILISDIAGSTGIAERLGDQAWMRILDAHNTIVRQRITEHGGTEVKAQGDGFLVVFPSARAAVLSAIAIQRAIAEHRREHPEVPIELRVGLHTGEVVATEDDVFGQNVVVASRIAAVADPGEILVSSLTRDLTASAGDLGFDEGTDVTLKGVSQPWRVHRVAWS